MQALSFGQLMDLITKVAESMPTSLRPIARKIILSIPINLFGESLTPPKMLTALYGLGDSERIGRNWVSWFIKYAGLKPEDKVLDVGCGIGRIAIPLTEYLDPKKGGCYEGFDIVPRGIEWCVKKISRRFPHFHFQLADIYNNHYNPNGRYDAAEYRFPYSDNVFDFVVLTSVFTHMLTKDVQNYLSEVSRVMKDGDNTNISCSYGDNKRSRCLVTYLLLNESTRKLINEGKAAYSFEYSLDGQAYTSNKKDPEIAVGYEESFITRLYEKYRLKTDNDHIFYGHWRDINRQYNQPMYEEFQDLIVSYRL